MREAFANELELMIHLAVRHQVFQGRTCSGHEKSQCLENDDVRPVRDLVTGSQTVLTILRINMILPETQELS